MQPGSLVSSDTRIYEDDVALAISICSGITWFLSTELTKQRTITFHVTDDVIARSSVFGPACTVTPPEDP